MRILIITALMLIAAMPAIAQAPAKRLAIGAVRPALNARSINGSPLSWDNLRGKVVVMDFWATWCGPCIGAIPHMNALKKELAGQPVRLLSITYEPKAKAGEFLAAHPMDTEVLLDNDLKTFDSFIAWGIPIAYVFDRKGRLVAALSPKNLTAEMIRTVLNGKTPEFEEHPGWSDPVGAAKYFREQLVEDQKKYGQD